MDELPLAAIDAQTIVTGLAVIFGTGGLFGGIYALLKLRPEAGQITVTTAQGVLIMQTEVMKELRLTNDRLQDRIDALEAENSSLMRRQGALERRINATASAQEDLSRKLDDETHRNDRIETTARRAGTRADQQDKRQADQELRSDLSEARADRSETRANEAERQRTKLRAEGRERDKNVQDHQDVQDERLDVAEGPQKKPDDWKE